MTKEVKEIYPYRECEQYVNLLQENITRMANNSASCKNWFIAIIVGSLAIAFSKENSAYLPQIVVILKGMTILFFFLDCLYLGLERRFKKAERLFIKKCKEEPQNKEDIKRLLMSFSSTLVISENTPDLCTKTGKRLWQQLKNTFEAMISWSTTPFYTAIFYLLHGLC